jgi:hypothetical protein
MFSMMAVLLNDLAFHSYRQTKDLVSLVGAALLENIGYRQITVWWRLLASWEYLKGQRSGWGNMERRGVGKV